MSGEEGVRVSGEEGVRVSGEDGVVMTSRREAVRRVLVRSDSFRSAQDIYADMRAEGAKIGLTTVYRALQALSEYGRGRCAPHRRWRDRLPGVPD